MSLKTVIIFVSISIIPSHLHIRGAPPQPLRAYLADTVVRALTEGMLEVCRVNPTDPVDYLAEFLFKHAEHARGQAAGGQLAQGTAAFAPERMTPRAAAQ